MCYERIFYILPNHKAIVVFCTCFKGFPVNGITIFGSQLHTHGSGRKVSTKHYRDGIELSEINRDDHYSAHFQEIRLLHTPRKILPVKIK